MNSRPDVSETCEKYERRSIVGSCACLHGCGWIGCPAGQADAAFDAHPANEIDEDAARYALQRTDWSADNDRAYSTFLTAYLDHLDVASLATLDAARDRPGLDETAEFWHKVLKDDPLLPDCSGTHMMGYAYCQRLAIAEAQQREGAGE